MRFDIEKSIQILNYFAEREKGSINYTKALKLVYFSDKLHLIKYAKTITGDQYFAMKFGPVASSVKDVIKAPDFFDSTEISRFFDIKKYEIVSKLDTDLDCFSKKEKDVLDEVYDFFGKYTWKELCEKTHKYSEWKKHSWVEELASSESMNIEDFFEISEDQDSIFNLSLEHLELSKEMYNDNKIYAL